MKRFLKWTAIAVGVLLLIGVSLAAFVNFSDLPTYEIRKIDLVVKSTPERVAHGREMAVRLCVNCHLDPTTKRLSGHRMMDLPKEFGVAYARNITGHRSAGIGSWTDGDIAWLLRTGIHPHTGRYLPPWMPKFPHMSDEDMYSIISWLRSNDPFLEPTDVASRESELTLLAKFLCRIAFKPFEYPSKSISHPDTSNTVTYGKYLTTAVYSCFECHSADLTTNNPLDPPLSRGFLGGGTKMPDAIGREIITSNLTPDKVHGIARYTREQFIDMMKTGIRPNGTAMQYPMIRMPSFSDHALGSMYDYFMTVTPIANHVSTPASTGPWKTVEARLWEQKGCAGCHGHDGVGFADMRQANVKYPDDSVLYDVILNQRAYNSLSTMPQYRGHLSEDELRILGRLVRRIN